jgi:hypothetical protein
MMRIDRAMLGVLSLSAVLATAACDGVNAFASDRPGTSGGFPTDSTGTQTGTLSGTVTADGGGLGAVTVILAGRDTTETNSQGVFIFVGLPASTYTVGVQVPAGYELIPGQSSTQTVTVTAGGTGTANWSLRRTTLAP